MPQLIEPATGKLRDVSDQDAAGALAAGWTPETASDVDRLSTGAANTLNYGGVGGGIKAALAGVARGATLGASDVAARMLGGQDTAAALEGLRAENPITSVGGEFAGMLLPAVVTGGAATPAGIASIIGRKVTAGATRAGAGVLERAAGHAVGAAAEGALYGGGQYLSQTALENKPLSAEGFVGGMGKGALFAAPVGGAFALGGEALLRARSLFPRSQITEAAGAAAKADASSALHESLADGDTMAATARQQIALADAQAGRAGARTQITRAVFGGADPAEMGAHVEATANKAQLVDALGKLETSQAALKEWIAAGGDAELEASMAGLHATEVQTSAGVPVGEFGAPGAGGVKSSGELARAAAEAGAPDVAASAATEPAPATKVLPKGTGRTPARTALDDIGATAVEPAKPTEGGGDLEALLRGTQEKLTGGASLNDIGAPARAEYAAGKAERTAAASEHFRSKANAENFAGSEMGAAEREAQAGQATSAGKSPALPDSHAELGKMFGIDLAPAQAEHVGNVADLKALLSSWSEENTGTIVDRAMRARMGPIADDAAIERLLQKRPGKNVDIGPQLARAAKVIGDHEAASADVAGLLGADAPKSAADRAQALQGARRAQAEAQGASAAKAGQGIQDRALPALGAAAGDKTAVTDDVARALQKHESAVEGAKDRALVSMQRGESKAAARAAAAGPAARGIGGKLADIGTALEVMRALGVHVPALSAIPVIGPVLGLFFKARAVLGILGRKGGSIGRDVDGVVAATAAATRDRVAAATQAILTGSGKGALKLSDIASGPAVTLGYKLFPGDGETKSKDPQKLYEARMDEIARALQPGAIDHAIADRYQTSDPNLHDALVAQTQRGIAFLDSKSPKPSILQSVMPGDGPWKPSKAQIDEFGKYVHAVGDPASVLEDLAKGHVTLEGAETLRVVYPELFAEGQRLLMQAAPEMQKTLPYPTRVAISILYRIPVDGSMQPGHLQYLQQGQQGPAAGPAPGGGAPVPPQGGPGLTGPIKLGQSTMTALDRRAGS